ncbi:histidine--tRNA ligase [Trifolium repens]|nr:histidine--tRNA ligase [Trifolium repens]
MSHNEVSAVTLGGKGSSLSSSSVYATATSQAQIRIDSSALDRLSSIPITQFESEEFSIRRGTPCHQRRILIVDENECSVLLGVSAVLDYQSAALATFVDVAAAFSCEALKADVTVFNLMDSGDGHSSKEEVGVAGDMRILLNGSKFVGNEKVPSIVKIPKVHGIIRERVKSVHSRMRVELNSGHKLGEIELGSEHTVCNVLLPLAMALMELGEFSFARAQSNLSAIGSNDLKSSISQIFGKQCPTDASLISSFNESFHLYSGRVYDKFAHEINVLFGLVWKTVAWELVTAYAVLEAAELNAKIGNVGENGENSKVEKKKKKAILGKGTSSILALIKDRLQSEKKSDAENSQTLETWVADFLSFLDLAKPEFNEFLLKVNDVVESNESRRLPKIPKGTRDFAKDQMTIRKKAFSVIEEVFERHGATALDTPVFELRETLMGKYGEDSKLIYDLADQGGELCSLRYDLTVPFARFVAMNGLTSLKRYQIAKVYRRDNPSKGRYREFYQCDFDIAGPSEKMAPDFEVVRILTELLEELNIGDFEVKLNHRKLLDGMMQICGVPPEKFRTICSSIDKLDKQPFDQIRKEMVEEKGLTAETADRIGTFVKEKGHPLTLLSKLKQEGSAFLENVGSVDALNDLEILFNALDKSKRLDKVVFDLSLARGLDYYTGVIFEAVFKGGAQVGSIAAGGRYDNLIGMFGSKQVPAVGVSLGIERVFVIMEQQLKDQNQMARPTKTEVLVSILGNDVTLAGELAGELWDAGVKAEFLVNKRRPKHFDYAKESRIPWMILVGEQEIKEGTVQLKHLEAGSDVNINIPRENFVEELRKRLNP